MPRYIRSIPACAGEPQFRYVHQRKDGVYPRVCGGTRNSIAHQRHGSGLSPRVRGNRRHSGHLYARHGSIPACAGEPSCPRPHRSASRVYPRVCGGTPNTCMRMENSTGLSPRVRGNPTTMQPSWHCLRSIPACAGEPHCKSCRSWPPRVYPRVCGGTFPTHPLAQVPIGLFPRVRGNLNRRASLLTVAGSIPACAGEPLIIALLSGGGSVYPRVCGGTPAPMRPSTRSQGLSPRVRGNHSPELQAARETRSIPACAGEPRGCQ